MSSGQIKSVCKKFLDLATNRRILSRRYFRGGGVLWLFLWNSFFPGPLFLIAFPRYPLLLIGTLYAKMNHSYCILYLFIITVIYVISFVEFPTPACGLVYICQIFVQNDVMTGDRINLNFSRILSAHLGEYGAVPLETLKT